jgi:hypothetical protein
MTIAVTEKKLEAACQDELGDEEVHAAGLFQPYGSGIVLAGGVSAGADVAGDLHLPGVAGGILSAAAGFAAERGLATAEHQPPWTAIAVTSSKIYAFDASAAGGTAATTKITGPYQVWERSKVAVHTTRYVLSFALVIEDTATKQSWQYKGNEIYKVGGKLVAHLLAEPADLLPGR